MVTPSTRPSGYTPRMTPLIAAAVIVALAVAWSRMHVSVLARCDTAARSGDAAPLLAALHSSRTPDKVTEYHQVIRRLWDGYHREVAVLVARDFAQAHREAPVAQFWLRRFLQEEPEIAATSLDEAFLAEVFNPGVAAKCGSYG